jgi:hypothetical protein
MGVVNKIFIEDQETGKKLENVHQAWQINQDLNYCFFLPSIIPGLPLCLNQDYGAVLSL